MAGPALQRRGLRRVPRPTGDRRDEPGASIPSSTCPQALPGQHSPAAVHHPRRADPGGAVQVQPRRYARRRRPQPVRDHRAPGRAGCNIRQEDFEPQLSRNNVIFRIPTPVFGAGLIEMIPDRAILANQAANASAKQSLGIGGRANRQRLFGQRSECPGRRTTIRNDGTISRFGWKAQVKSLLLFSGEAYNVEMGITSELFHTRARRDDHLPVRDGAQRRDRDGSGRWGVKVSAIENFAFFQRFLASSGAVVRPRPAAPRRSAAAAASSRRWAARSATRRSSGPAIRRSLRCATRR